MKQKHTKINSSGTGKLSGLYLKENKSIYSILKYHISFGV